MSVRGVVFVLSTCAVAVLVAATEARALAAVFRGSCDERSNGQVCTEFYVDQVPNKILMLQEKACGGREGTWSAKEKCPSEKVKSHCELRGGVQLHFYAAVTLADAQKLCEGAAGVFSKP